LINQLFGTNARRRQAWFQGPSAAFGPLDQNVRQQVAQIKERMDRELGSGPWRWGARTSTAAARSGAGSWLAPVSPCWPRCGNTVCARGSTFRLIWKPAHALGGGRRRTWKSSCPGSGVRKSAWPTRPRGDRHEARAAPALLRTRLQRGGPGPHPGAIGPPASLEPGATLPAGVSGFGLAQWRRTTPSDELSGGAAAHG